MPETRLSEYAQRKRALWLTHALTWRELGNGPSPAGDVGGDAQEGDAFSRCWAAELPNGLFARIEMAFYVQRKDRRPMLGIPSDLPEPEPLSISRQIEYMVCRDPEDAGTTEVASETEQDDPYEWFDTEPTEANAKIACESVYQADVEWPTGPERVLNVLTHGLPTVTDNGPVDVAANVTRLWIGAVCIGTVTRVHLDTGYAYIAQAHDWDGDHPIPLSTEPGEPGDQYDPMHAGIYEDPSEAFTEVVTRVPAKLSRSLYEPAHDTQQES